MSQENVELAREILAALGTRDPSRLIVLSDPEVEWHSFSDFAVLVGRIHFRGKGSGVESTSPAGWMLKFRDGKLLRFRAFGEPAQALEAVGLEE